jgi:hypothetical protein
MEEACTEAIIYSLSVHLYQNAAFLAEVTTKLCLPNVDSCAAADGPSKERTGRSAVGDQLLQMRQAASGVSCASGASSTIELLLSSPAGLCSLARALLHVRAELLGSRETSGECFSHCSSEAPQEGEQALRRLSAALEQKGGVLTPHALHLLGDICRRNNQQQDASDAYRAALKANPLLWCSYEALCQLGSLRLVCSLLRWLR